MSFRCLLVHKRIFELFPLDTFCTYRHAINTSCWILRPKRSGFVVLCIIGIISFRRCTTGSISFFRYSIPTVIEWDVDRQLDGTSLSDSPEAKEDARRRSWWIRWLVGRIISCAHNLGGWERYDDVGHGKNIGSRVLLLAAAIMAARALPPQTNICRMAKEKRHGVKILAALRRAEPDGRVRSSIQLSGS